MSIDYYNQNAEDYINRSKDNDMSSVYAEFLPHVEEGGSILDIGSGSGRDLKYFCDAGYRAIGLDASEELASFATKYAGCDVKVGSVIDSAPLSIFDENQFDAAWACASLVHLTDDEIRLALQSIGLWLKPNGILFTCFKSGEKPTTDSEGRWFNRFTEDRLKMHLAGSRSFQLIKFWQSSDSAKRDFDWLNVVLRNQRS